MDTYHLVALAAVACAFKNKVLHFMSLANFSCFYVQNFPESNINQTQAPESDLAIDGRGEDLMRDVKQAFIARSGKIYGEFSEDLSKAPLFPWLREWREGKMSFTSLCQNLVQHWQSSLDISRPEVDGNLLFMLDSVEEGQFLYIVLLDHREGLYFDSQLQLADSIYLDVAKMQLAVKISVDQALVDDEKNYLAIFKGRGDKTLADFFTHFIGLGEPLDTASATEAFLHMVNDYTGAMETERAVEARAQVVDYCVQQDKLGETVEYTELSKTLADTGADEGEEQFAQFIAQYQESRELPTEQELIPDRNKIRQFVRISGRSDLLSMSFNADCLGESIIYDSATDSLTITSIPNSLKMRLMKHMQK